MNNLEGLTINNSNVERIIADKAIGYNKISFNVLLPGQIIRSKNYVSGESGWALNGSGNAELNGLVSGYAKLEPQDTEPDSEKGMLYVNSSGVLKIYNGSSWVSVGSQT